MTFELSMHLIICTSGHKSNGWGILQVSELNVESLRIDAVMLFT